MNSRSAETVPYRFTLFVVGKEVNSVIAEENLRHICAEHLLKGLARLRSWTS